MRFFPFTMILIFVFVLNLKAKDKNQVFYPVAAIPEPLKKDANAVIRTFDDEFELIDYGRAVEKVHWVVTVLNENGDSFGKFYLRYDQTQKIKSISGRSYNELGVPDDKLKSSDIQDVNYTISGIVFDDFRKKISEFKTTTYPYTVEYEYEIEYNGLEDYPDWYPLNNYQLAVEQSSHKITFPDNLKIRYKEFYISPSSKSIVNKNGKTSITWKVDSLVAIKEEPMAPLLNSCLTHVICAPFIFDYYNTHGEMSSWNSLGKWEFELLKGLDELPEERKIEIQKLVGEIKDTLQTINILYKYLQNKTRYVGIEVGLGGQKPFSAKTVDKTGYGDCKALSNYMKSLLSCVGIKSYYTSVGAEPNQGITMPDFPSLDQSNHVILCIPFRNDTVWLECTSQTKPAGYMGRSTQNRKALLITEKGGIIAKTPFLLSQDNLQCRTATVKIETNGAIQAEVKTHYKGYQYDNVSYLFEESKEDQQKELLDNLGIPGLKLNTFAYDVRKNRIPEAFETLSLNSEKYASKTGPRLFIPLNLLNQRKSSPAKVETRRLPVVQTYAYHDKDSIVYTLPAGYVTESVPKQKVITTEFGEYKASITVENNKAIYVREVKINYGTWPKEKYAEVVDFYTGIVLADKAKLVLKVQ